MIYAAETFAAALLEVLVHSNLGRVPRTHVVIEIAIPDTLRVEYLLGQNLPGWNAEDQSASRDFGDPWLANRRSTALLVPSVVTRGRGHNVLINPEHHDFVLIVAGQPEMFSGMRDFFSGSGKSDSKIRMLGPRPQTNNFCTSR